MRFDVFGTPVEVLAREGQWLVFYLGSEGKKRLATDIIIPPQITESQVRGYLADIRHEYASQEHPQVTRIS